MQNCWKLTQKFSSGITDSTFLGGQKRILHLLDGAADRVKTAFRPKTKRYYYLLFRNFVAFCCLAKILVQDVNVHVIMTYLEFLARNGVSVHMIVNNVAAIKANYVMYGIDHAGMDHPRINTL